MKKDVKYPIILENPTTRVVFEFLLKQFGVRINGNDQVFLCPKETCEIDYENQIMNNSADPRSEHFICLFFIDKKQGFMPIVPSENIQKFVVQKTWKDSLQETLGDAIKRLGVKPDFVVTFGRLEMPIGISNMCWCVHEFLWWKDGEVNGESEGVFDTIDTIPLTVKMFTNYLWNLPNLKMSAIISSISTPSEPKPKASKASTASTEKSDEEPVDLGEVFKMETVIKQVLQNIPFEEQKKLLIRFCQKTKDFEGYLDEISSWNEARIKQFILENDILNDFDEHRESIAQAMTSMMSNEGIVEPTD